MPKKRSDKRISLAPLTPDEALKVAMQTGPHPKDEKGEAPQEERQGNQQKQRGRKQG